MADKTFPKEQLRQQAEGARVKAEDSRETNGSDRKHSERLREIVLAG